MDLKIRRWKAAASWSVLSLYLEGGEKILDVGAGDCLLAEMIRKKCPGIVGVDIKNYNLTKSPLVLYDGKVLPFKSRCFDAAILVYILHHCDDLKAVLLEVKRVCRKQIIIFEDVVDTFSQRIQFKLFHWYLDRVIRVPTGPGACLNLYQWRALFEQLGFKEGKVINLGRDHKFFPNILLAHRVFILEVS